jgi:hypothetical protein
MKIYGFYSIWQEYCHIWNRHYNSLAHRWFWYTSIDLDTKGINILFHYTYISILPSPKFSPQSARHHYSNKKPKMLPNLLYSFQQYKSFSVHDSICKLIAGDILHDRMSPHPQKKSYLYVRHRVKNVFYAIPAMLYLHFQFRTTHKYSP